MKLKSSYFYIFIMFLMLSTTSCFDIGAESDSASTAFLFSAFDTRDRDSYIQLTEITGTAATIHVQIFDVSNNCNENDFFDNYTPNDTHVYNLKDIQTNDGNPSGVVLPDGAYGLVAFTITSTPGSPLIIGNSRILDGQGYEYRTNLVAPTLVPDSEQDITATLNFNNEGGVGWSDVIGFNLEIGEGEVFAANITDNFALLDIDIYNLDEVPFSCRNVIFACTDQDNPLYEALLEEAQGASVASFEYGINDAVPHSRDGELLCPGNNIDEGFVRINVLDSDTNTEVFGMFIGLNNGAGRGSMDSFWVFNPFVGGFDG